MVRGQCFVCRQASISPGRSQPRTGPRHLLPKTENSSDLSHMAARHPPEKLELFRCPELHKSVCAPLATRFPLRPRYSDPFLIDRCSPGCSMLPYHSALLDNLPVARIDTLLTNWCPPCSLSFFCVPTTLPADRRPNDDSAY